MTFLQIILQILLIELLKQWGLIKKSHELKTLIKYLSLISPLFEKHHAQILQPIHEYLPLLEKYTRKVMMQNLDDLLQVGFLLTLVMDDVENVMEME